ncbi:hypothetical protein HispidOSU_011335, partial [Sigmodon hispidus]
EHNSNIQEERNSLTISCDCMFSHRCKDIWWLASSVGSEDQLSFWKSWLYLVQSSPDQNLLNTDAKHSMQLTVPSWS